MSMEKYLQPKVPCGRATPRGAAGVYFCQAHCLGVGLHVAETLRLCDWRTIGGQRCPVLLWVGPQHPDELLGLFAGLSRAQVGQFTLDALTWAGQPMFEAGSGQDLKDSSLLLRMLWRKELMGAHHFPRVHVIFRRWKVCDAGGCSLAGCQSRLNQRPQHAPHSSDGDGKVASCSCFCKDLLADAAVPRVGRVGTAWEAARTGSRLGDYCAEGRSAAFRQVPDQPSPTSMEVLGGPGAGCYTEFRESSWLMVPKVWCRQEVAERQASSEGGWGQRRAVPLNRARQVATDMGLCIWAPVGCLSPCCQRRGTEVPPVCSDLKAASHGGNSRTGSLSTWKAAVGE